MPWHHLGQSALPGSTGNDSAEMKMVGWSRDSFEMKRVGRSHDCLLDYWRMRSGVVVERMEAWMVHCSNAACTHRGESRVCREGLFAE